MHYKAITFDLFGTLVKVVSFREMEETLMQVAEVLSISSSNFIRLWYKDTDRRVIGLFPTIEDNISSICNELVVYPDNDQTTLATKLIFEYGKQLLTPRIDTILMLSRCRVNGLKIGLISDCFPDTPMVWNETPFS